MLRRDPTTIRLVAEDIKDLGSNLDYEIIQRASLLDTDSRGKFGSNTVTQDIDNQNWDSSLDESYLGSRSREKDLKRDFEGSNLPTMEKERERNKVTDKNPDTERDGESLVNVNNSLLRGLGETEAQHQRADHNRSGDYSSNINNVSSGLNSTTPY